MRAWCMPLAAGASQKAFQNSSSATMLSKRLLRCSFASPRPARITSAANAERSCSVAGR